MSARTLALATAGLALALTAAPARAVVSCTVAAVGPAFGIYAQLSPTSLRSNGSVSLTCTLVSGGPVLVAGVVTLSTGSSGSYAARTMGLGMQTLNYNIYLDAAYSQVWGDTTGGSFDWIAKMKLTPGDLTEQATGVLYGQVPAAQDPAATGAYLDTIVVTVTY